MMIPDLRTEHNPEEQRRKDDNTGQEILVLVEYRRKRATRIHRQVYLSKSSERPPQKKLQWQTQGPKILSLTKK